MDFINSIFNFFKFDVSILPTSPFKDFIDSLQFNTYLPFINWFFPIGDFIVIGTAWLSCIGIFYLYLIILRWIKAIGD